MKDRIKAASLHLLFSILLIGCSVGLILLHFYPSVFLDIENTFDALKILIPADIVLGPLLTLIIYKKGKPGLRFDLSMIIVCQLAAMSYGCWAIYTARPGFLVFHGDAFYTVPPRIDQTPLQNSELEVGPFSSPKIAYIDLPGDAKERFRLAMQSAAAGIPVHWQAQYFKNFNDIDSKRLIKTSLGMAILKKKSSADTRALLDKIEIAGEKYVYIPVVGTSSSQVLVVNLATRKPEYTLDINPF